MGFLRKLFGRKSQAVELHIAALEDKDEGVRAAAVKMLVKIGASAVEPLVAAIRDWHGYYDRDKRQTATEALVKIGLPAVEPLIAALQDKESNTRQAAAQALGRIGNKRAVKPLLATLEDDDTDVKRDTVSALDSIGWQPDDSKAGALYWTVKYLYAEGTGSENVRQAASDALKRTGWQPDRSEAGATCRIARHQWDECVKIGVPAVKPLFITLQDTDETIRQAVTEALVQIGEPAVDLLISLLDEHYRWSHTDASSLLLRITAANVLGKIGDPRAIKVLIDMGSKTERTLEHRRAAANALAMIGEPAFEPLVGILQGDRADLQQLAAWALGNIGDTRAVESLIPILSTTPFHYPHAREAAGEALKAITGQDFGENVGRWQEWWRGFAPGGGPHTVIGQIV